MKRTIPKVNIKAKSIKSSFRDCNCFSSSITLFAYVSSANKIIDAINPDSKPCIPALLTNGEIINEALAPTSCILLIRNR